MAEPNLDPIIVLYKVSERFPIRIRCPGLLTVSTSDQEARTTLQQRGLSLDERPPNMKKLLMCCLLLSLAVFTSCAPTEEDSRYARAVSAMSSGGSSTCTQSSWNNGLCDLVVVTAYSGRLSPGTTQQYFYLANNFGTSPYVFESGRLSQNIKSGSTTRLDMWAIRENWRNLCLNIQPPLQVSNPCGVSMNFVAGSFIMILEVYGNPYDGNNIMPRIHALRPNGNGTFVSAEEVYSVHYAANTPESRLVGRVMSASGASWMAPNPDGTVFSATYGAWYALP